MFQSEHEQRAYDKARVDRLAEAFGYRVPRDIQRFADKVRAALWEARITSSDDACDVVDKILKEYS